MIDWYTDRTRYTRGYECRWKRLLGFHAFDTGLVLNRVAVPLLVGRYVHTLLEKMMRTLANPTPPHSGKVDLTLKTVIAEEWKRIADQFDSEISTANYHMDPEEIAFHRDTVPALAHGYARAAVPFVINTFEITHVEQEISYRIPDTNIIWMARPDFIAKERAPAEPNVSPTNPGFPRYSVHDFKTASYWDNSRGPTAWANSIQMMANAYVAAKTLDVPISTYYMHMLIKGNTRYPSFLTYAYWRPASPPLFNDQWSPTRQPKMSKVRVAAHRDLEGWIWQQLPSDLLSEKFPLVGPYSVFDYTVESFLRGVVTEEQWWQYYTHDLDWKDWHKLEFQNELDRRFPRTYACYDFSGHRCQFYNLCHKGPAWDAPLHCDSQTAPVYMKREPHHPQEEINVD